MAICPISAKGDCQQHIITAGKISQHLFAVFYAIETFA
jgi:hypothetical protein